MSLSESLQTAINKLESLNCQLKDKLKDNPTNSEELSVTINKNNSLILDYKFRLRK